MPGGTTPCFETINFWPQCRDHSDIQAILYRIYPDNNDKKFDVEFNNKLSAFESKNSLVLLESIELI